MPELDLTFVDEAVSRIGKSGQYVIALLQAIQEHYRYLPEPALRRLCQISDITPAAVAGVSTFYTQFRHKPVGQHMIRVCHGTACHIKGAQAISDAIKTALKIPDGDDTDPDKLFTLEKIACLGCCTLAPVVQIDEVIYGHLTGETVPRMLRDFLESRSAPAKRRARRAVSMTDGELPEVRIGLGSCCQARGSGRVFQAVEQALADNDVQAVVKRVGCVGMCHQTPLVEVVVPGKPPALYAQVKPEDAPDIALRHLQPRTWPARACHAVNRLLESLLTDDAWTPPDRYALDTREQVVSDFLGRQRHIASEHCGVLDPLDLDEYQRRDGLAGLTKAINTMTPGQIIQEIEHSGLRGRGGAGFTTGRKWQAVADAPGDDKYIVCNCDEGDPGAFMDRMLMESYPFRVLEGMLIAAHAVGARRGYLYIRAEYPLAVQRVREALGKLRARGLLAGEAGTPGLLDLRSMEGAGAFVCGEETALLASIEGKRGMPRFRPPFPARSGLWGKPTLVNNVETYALVPWILRNGAEAFAAMGTAGSKGTKVFALAGKIVRGGLIEVPMGVTLHQVVHEIGGGVPNGKKLKAVQVGGPSGGCVPAELAHIAVDYDALTSVGAIMGSGGLVVLDEDDCMVDIARYFLSFTQDQSCGKCTFCRVGTRVMLDILDRLCAGQGKAGDIEQLEDLAQKVKKGSLCGLGGTAPNPVISTLRYFRHEYEAHLQGRCPAGRCKALIRYRITDDCIGCTKCAQQCPTGAIAMKPHEVHEIDQEMCVRCGGCRNICPVNSVVVE